MVNHVRTEPVYIQINFIFILLNKEKDINNLFTLVKIH